MRIGTKDTAIQATTCPRFPLLSPHRYPCSRRHTARPQQRRSATRFRWQSKTHTVHSALREARAHHGGDHGDDARVRVRANLLPANRRETGEQGAVTQSVVQWMRITNQLVYLACKGYPTSGHTPFTQRQRMRTNNTSHAHTWRLAPQVNDPQEIELLTYTQRMTSAAGTRMNHCSKNERS